jgi:putative tryptophan/tyrosine transport system substrate-binding protein
MTTRRTFIAGLGVTAAWPLVARAQQPAMPVIGLLDTGTAEGRLPEHMALRDGLRDAGYVESRNLTIEYRFAENHYERLPALAADLVRRRVAVIVAGGGGGVGPLAAKAATATIPIVFTSGADPVQAGLVSNLNRPSGNITGVSFASNISESRRLGLLHAMVPGATAIGALINPDNGSAATEVRDLNEAALSLGLKLEIANARNEGDFEPAFAGFARQRVGGLIIAADAFFAIQIAQLASLAVRYGLPSISAGANEVRSAAEAGLLMSYGANVPPAFRQAGIYVGRILHGEKPGDLPVMLPTHFELVINLKIAKALGIEVPPTLSAIADEIIE